MIRVSIARYDPKYSWIHTILLDVRIQGDDRSGALKAKIKEALEPYKKEVKNG